MMNFRKIAAASKGALILRYFTENTPEPIHDAPVDAAGRQLAPSDKNKGVLLIDKALQLRLIVFGAQQNSAVSQAQAVGATAIDAPPAQTGAGAGEQDQVKVEFFGCAFDPYQERIIKITKLHRKD